MAERIENLRQLETLCDTDLAAEYWQSLAHAFAVSHCDLHRTHYGLSVFYAIRNYRAELMSLVSPSLDGASEVDRLQFADQVLSDEFNLFCESFLETYDGDKDPRDEDENEWSSQPGCRAADAAR